ncbi:hypothetical protein LTS10_006306 [Elasticomyces elasticus]|nr:hypothetical protein LTS10_006306 [Elasticomyces elasticus]
MSDPSPIANRYKRYKAGTNKLTRWLYIKGSGEGTHVKSTQATRLTTQDLVRLAASVVSATPHVDIPLEIIVVTEDVIEARQVCVDWYSSTSDGSSENEKQDAGHVNFIAVLKTILSKLQKAYEEHSTRQQKSKRGVAVATKAEIKQNIFDYLDFEEPTPAPLENGAKPSRSAGTSEPTKAVCPELSIQEVEDADKAFAIWCFFKDQFEVCQFLKSQWQQHAAGKLGFVTVCEVTGNAFMLMQKASDELVAAFPSCGHTQDILDFLGFETCVIDDEIAVLTFREQKVANMIRSTPAVHELFCIKACTILSEFKTLISRDGKRVSEHANRTHRFASVLRSMVPELLLLHHTEGYTAHYGHRARVRPTFGDDFVEGLLSAYTIGNVAPSLLTMCQAYMHIYDALGPQVAEGFELLHGNAGRFRQAQKKRRQFVEAMGGLSPWDLERCDEHESARLEQYTEKDFMVWIQEKMASAWPHLGTPSAPFQMQKLLPVSSGMMLYNQQLDVHCSGLAMSNAGFAVVAAAYLYKAAKRCGLLETEWADMNFFLTQHKAGKSVMLEQTSDNTSLETLARQYRISLGGRPPKKNEKKPDPPNVKMYTRTFGASHRFRMSELPPLEQSIKLGRLMGEHNASPFLQHIGNDYRNNPSYEDGTTSLDNLLERALHSVANAALDEKAAAAGIDRHKGREARSWKLSSVELLESFVDMLMKDELNFNFDYLSFTKGCYDMLSLMTRKHAAIDADEARGAYQLVNVMLWELAGTEQKGKGAIKLEDTILSEVQGILQRYIGCAGSRYLDEARPRCSPHMPLPSQLQCPSMKFLTGPVEPRLHMEDLSAVKSLYREKGVEFQFDQATNTIMMYNPAWKSRYDARRELLQWFGADQATIEAVTKERVISLAIPVSRPPVTS